MFLMQAAMPTALQETDSRRPCILLDRDGTLIHNRHYLSHPDGIEWLPGVIEGLKTLDHFGYCFAVISNQSGIARGYFTAQTLRNIETVLQSQLLQHGIRIPSWLHCPHHPDENCRCRKPLAGMLDRWADWPHLDHSRSWMIGDQPCDAGFAQNAGVRAILIQNESLSPIQAPFTRCRNFSDAVLHILKNTDTNTSTPPASPRQQI
jgi:histidinol-phosphate phosphatase family protein